MTDKNSFTFDGKTSEAPASIVAAIDRFVEHRIAPGSFVRAVLCNDLAAAFRTGDEDSLRGLEDIMRYIHWEIPGGCHGSESKVKKWLKGQEVEASPSLSESRNDLLRNASLKTLGDYLDAEYDIGAAHQQRADEIVEDLVSAFTIECEPSFETWIAQQDRRSQGTD